MDKISKLNEKLKPGDLKQISELGTIPYDTVQKIFSKKRNWDTPVGRRATKIANLIILKREEIEKSLSEV